MSTAGKPVARRSLFAFVGFLLAFAFGTLWGVLTVRLLLEQQAAETLRQRGRPTFAALESSRQISRVGRTYYFYSYSGTIDGHRFRREEQVPPDLYYLQSEGKNIIVRAFRDASGHVHARIANNPLPYPSDLNLIRTFCLAIAAASLVVALLGTMARLFGRNTSDESAAD